MEIIIFFEIISVFVNCKVDIGSVMYARIIMWLANSMVNRHFISPELELECKVCFL